MKYVDWKFNRLTLLFNWNAIYVGYYKLNKNVIRILWGLSKLKPMILVSEKYIWKISKPPASVPVFHMHSATFYHEPHRLTTKG